MPPSIRMEVKTSNSSSSSPEASPDHTILSPTGSSPSKAGTYEGIQNQQASHEAGSGSRTSPAGMSSCWEDTDDKDDATKAGGQVDQGLPFNVQIRASIVRVSVAYTSLAGCRSEYGVADYGNAGIELGVGSLLKLPP